MAVRALGVAALFAIAIAGCGRAHKTAPRVTVDSEGGDSGQPMPPGASGGTSGGTSGESGTSTGGSAGGAGRSAEGGNGGAAGTGASGGRGGSAGAGGGDGGEDTAGGSSGIGASSGSAGMPARPEPVAVDPVWSEPLPSDCARTSEVADELGCDVSMDCALGPLLVHCWTGNGGVANCECSTDFGTIGPFEIAGLPDLGTCRTVAQVCSSGEELDLDGPETCSALFESSDATSCSLHQTCVNELESGNVKVGLRRQRSIACVEWPDDVVLCECGVGPLGPLRYELANADPSTACDAMIGQCDELPNVDPDDPVACTLDVQATFDGYCHADARCTRTTEQGNDVTRLYEERRDAHCSGGDEPGSTCTCGVDERYITFHREPLVESIDDCNHYLDVCTTEAFDLVGAATCDAWDEGAGTNDCWASYLCEQPAMLADESVLMLGRLWTSCVPSDDGWECHCRSTRRGVTISVPADDAAAACLAARDACPEAIPVSLWDPP